MHEPVSAWTTGAGLIEIREFVVLGDGAFIDFPTSFELSRKGFCGSFSRQLCDHIWEEYQFSLSILSSLNVFSYDNGKTKTSLENWKEHSKDFEDLNIWKEHWKK